MRPRRRTYTAATPPSLVTVKPIVEAVAVPVSGTKRRRRKLQSCTAKKAKDGSKKKNKCDIGGGLWEDLIPLDILRKILPGLGLKANIQASVVCKAWCEAAVSVRKFQLLPPPLLFNSRYSMHIKGVAIPDHPLRFPTCKLQFPGTLHCSHNPAFSKDGWVLSFQGLTPLLHNPFTRETSFYLPRTRRFRWLAFSAAPTSAICMVISYTHINATVVVDTWRPGETVWTTHSFENQLPFRIWGKCVLPNGMFYCLSACGYLGVFHPSSQEATWNVLPLKKPCPAYFNPFFLTEHQGDIFVIHTHNDNSNPTVFKLNSKRKEWQEKRDLGGLTIFTSLLASFVRAGLSMEHRNKIYSSCIDEFERYGTYYSLGDPKSSDPHPPPPPPPPPLQHTERLTTTFGWSHLPTTTFICDAFLYVF